MNESLLDALLKLFAIIVDVKHFKNHDIARKVVVDYFQKEHGRTQADKCIIYFDDHLKQYHQGSKNNQEIDISVYDSRIDKICSAINGEFEQKQKIWLCLQLVEFLDDAGYRGKDEVNILRKIAEAFNIDSDEFEQAKNLILRQVDSLKLTEKLLIIDGNKNFPHSKALHLYKEKMTVRVFVLQLKKSDLCISQ